MIVVIGGQKGGSGKSLIATNLAVMRSLDSKKVLLVDADEQESVTIWKNQRQRLNPDAHEINFIRMEGKNFYVEILKIKDGYDDIVVDVGGRITTTLVASMSAADIFVTSFRPRAVETWTIDKIDMVVDLVKGVNPEIRCIGVVSQADATGNDNHEAKDFIRESRHLECFEGLVGMRKIYSNAFGDGLTIADLKGKPSGLEKSQEEMKDLYEYVFNV